MTAHTVDHYSGNGSSDEMHLVGVCADHPASNWDWQVLSHPRVQLVARGSMRIITEDRIHVVPAGQAVWIPAGLRFQASTAGELRLWTVDFPESNDHNPITVFRAPPLMREMARTSCAWRSNPPEEAPVSAFSAAFVGMLPIWRRDVLPTDIPTASSKQLRRALAHMLTRLGRPVGLADAALAGAVSERTLQRRCRTELDMSLSSWLTRARVVHSLELLSAPETDRSVAAIARSCGYNSPAAFTRAFSQLLSTTPSAWRSSATLPEVPEHAED
jgi:AraC-like DNA-binding protein/mannose-6-phosphate isomerase-like protein (cupin superfamily)